MLQDCFGTYFTHAQSCDNVHVQSATDWAASVHTLRMPKAVIMFVFIVLRNGLLRYIHMPKAVITFVFIVLRNGLCFRRFRVFAVFAFSFSAGGTPAAGTQISCAQQPATLMFGLHCTRWQVASDRLQYNMRMQCHCDKRRIPCGAIETASNTDSDSPFVATETMG